MPHKFNRRKSRCKDKKLAVRLIVAEILEEESAMLAEYNSLIEEMFPEEFDENYLTRWQEVKIGNQKRKPLPNLPESFSEDWEFADWD